MRRGMPVYVKLLSALPLPIDGAEIDVLTEASRSDDRRQLAAASPAPHMESVRWCRSALTYTYLLWLSSDRMNRTSTDMCCDDGGNSDSRLSNPRLQDLGRLRYYHTAHVRSLRTSGTESQGESS
jgi:hypothetical protein